MLIIEGAGATVHDKGKGYYYGGYLTNASVPGHESQPIPLSSLVVYNMIENTLKNYTHPDGIPRAEGVMVYVPAGDAGFLVYFGGVQFPNANVGNYTPVAVGFPPILKIKCNMADGSSFP
jgi:hypothetical protein